MKLIIMRCNVKKELKKQQKKELKNILSFKNIRKLEKMSREEQDMYFNNLDKDFENKTKSDFEKLYLNYFLMEKKLNNKKALKYSNEIACTLENEELLKKNTTFIKDEYLNNKFIDTTKKIFNRLSKILGNKYVKKVLFASLSIALGYTCHKLQYSAVVCGTGAGASIDNAFFYIRSISGVICFICMTIEIVQNAVQGDVRVIWYVVAKYLAIMVAILSFRKIFTIIDQIFNG